MHNGDVMILCKMRPPRQCSLCGMSILTDSGPYDVMITSSRNFCHNFGAKYLGNEARERDGSNGQPIGKCPWAIVWACSR